MSLFYQKYELLDLIRNDGIKTFSAEELATRRTVSAHILAGLPNSEVRLILDQIDQLPPAPREKIIETGDHEGTTYIVTTEWPGNVGLREWLADSLKSAQNERFTKAGSWRVPANVFSQKVADATPPDPGTPEARELENFTRRFGITPASAATPPLPEPAPPVPDPVEPRPPSPPKLAPEPGEFTRMFVAPTPQATGQHAAPSAPEPATAQPPSADPQVSEPGEFTRMFVAPTPQATGRHAAAPVDTALNPPMAPPPLSQLSHQPPGQPPPDKNEPGEFTRMFVAPTPHATGQHDIAPADTALNPPAPAVPLSQSQSAPAQPQPQARNTSADATRLFAVPVPREAPPAAAPPASAQRPGEFTSMFQSPATPAPGRPAPAKSDPRLSDTAEVPGEFSRFFQNPSETPAPRQHPALNDPFDRSKVPAPAPPSDAPGQFTRMFGVPSKPGAPAPPPYTPSGFNLDSPEPAAFTPAPGAPQSATGAFSVPKPQYGVPPAPDNQQPQGPGEYTRMFSASSPAAMEQPAPPSQPSVLPAIPEARKPSLLPLFLILGLIFIIAVIVVLYFAMRK